MKISIIPHPLFLLLVLISSLSLYNNVVNAQDRDPMSKRKTYIGGHRGNGCSTPGCSSITAENSIHGIQTAILNGAEFIEIDLWLTLDHQVVVVHGKSQGNLEETVIGNVNNLESVNYEELIAMEKLYHRKPWSLTLPGIKNEKNVTSSEDEQIMEGIKKWKQSSKREMEIEKQRYRENEERSNDIQQVPLLKDLLEAVCYMPEFQVKRGKFILEMKGSKSELGNYVLKIIEPHVDCIGMFSSFHYIPMGCTKEFENIPSICPNGYKAVGNDLLRPMIDNYLHIPIALLFNGGGKRLPGINDLDRMLKEYHSQWMHCRNDFKSVEKGDSLKVITEKLHKLDYNVMIYTKGYNTETYEELVLAVEANVDFICTNTIEVAKKALMNTEI